MKRIKELLKQFFKKIGAFLKKVFSKKRNIIIAAIIGAIILIVILIGTLVGKKSKFALNEIYDVYPEEVRELYTNIVNVSCSGDLHLNLEVGSKAQTLSQIDKETLIDYMFSYLDKNEKLSDNFNKSVLEAAERELFLDDVNLFAGITKYNYGNYEYTIKDKITRKVRKCESDDKYVTHLYGYSVNEKKDKLSMDVNAGYLKDGKLYDYTNKELGEYDGDVTKLPELTRHSTYYRFTFYKKNGKFKLFSIEHKNRV